MAYPQQRYSSYSASTAPAPQPSQQVSTQTLLNALHSAYATSKAYSVESSTSLVVNTWITAATEGPDGRRGGTVDVDLARKAWEHARRRAEDGCIILGSLHDSTPSLFAPFISALPINVPPVLYAALSAIQPFVQCAAPENPTKTLYSSLAATFTLSLSSNLIGASLKLSRSGIDTNQGLLNIPATKGNRAFNAFYYLLNSASSSEREFLGLKGPSSYSLLRKSETYHPPSYLPTADDAAAADEFRTNLKVIGISGHARRNLISVLAAILKLGDCLDLLIEEEELAAICEEIADLLNVDPEVLLQNCSSQDRAVLIAGLYESLVDWVVMKANTAIAADIAGNKVPDSASDSDGRPGALTPALSEAEGDTVSISVIDIPSPRIGKAVALKTVFDDSEGINAEMKEDGVSASQPGHSVINDMRTAVSECETELGIHGGHAGREKELEEDRRERILDRVGQESEDDSFIKTLLYPEIGQGITLGKYGRFDLPLLIGSSRVWFHLSLHPTDDLPAALAANAAAWSASSPSRQLRAWRLPEWANRRNKQFDFTADFDIDEFCNRYERLGCRPGKEGIENFILERGWSNGEVIIGKERVWVREGSWWEAESTLDLLPQGVETPGPMLGNEFGVQHPGAGSQYFASPYESGVGLGESRDNLLQRNQSLGARTAARSLAPTAAHTVRSVSGGDYGLGSKGDDMKGAISSYNDLDPELNDPNHITHKTTSGTRRMWVTLTWMLTFWIPSFTLRYIGRMKRPDVRMAWREKLVLVLLIFFLNAAIIFYIIEFGRLLCPNYDKAWNDVQVSYHQGDSDFYVSVRGAVYDISKFWKTDHSSIAGAPVTDSAMLAVAGQNVDYMFPIPLAAGCAGLVSANDYVQLETNATNANPAVINSFQHTSGHFTHYPQSAFKNPDWYNVTFLPAMKQYYKGERVYSTKNVTSESDDETKTWAIINNNVYDLSDYFYTIAQNEGATMYEFLDPDVQTLFQQNSGTDITDDWNKFALGNSSSAEVNMNCLNNVFYVGKTDFRDTPRCQVNNYILLAFTLILCAVILVKFLAALQLGGKRKPAMQDKFVICQVPAYTEGEDQLRKGLDSLTALAYDNKRKLICVICDGMIVGGGNDRPTPKIVLDILGVDPKIDPPALPFKSVGQSNEQLNYGKVYSGLYEYEGNVVPYIVVVKVGKESEQTKAKPGNRGKRDSQILLMSFLNRVHHRAPMSPLELEMFHQINNIIGVDPELYEYLFMVDADTMVKEDSLNRLVSNCANDAKIAGICGETSLQNEERSWWTMIQVYEYYISHHLAKAFESLFGSVTCLPGCFCMYRLRTADKGKPLIISDKVVTEYADCDVDTLHKKNLLSLGEDRYLTTLMTKHFPNMKYKFVPAAQALTAAPESWSVLLSQRRRWINSTIHNLAELMFLRDMCGFCCFSMRFVVFIDLFGTIILPATCAYIGYLIYEVVKDPHNFPLVSIIMLAAVYGLQMLIFIIKRQWQHIGWMIIYLIAFPVYSFLLPVYSFWRQDDFSWGSTRIVIGEKGNKQVVAIEDEGFDPRSIPLQRWDDYAVANNLPGSRGPAGNEKEYSQFGDGAGGAGYEMDDMRSVYSAAKPASTILTGFKSHGGMNYHIPPQSPSPFQNRSMTPNPNMRQSTYSAFTRYTDNPHPVQSPPLPIHSPAMSQHAFNASNQRLMSLGNMSQAQFPSGVPGYAPSENNLMVHPNHSQASGMMLNRAGTQTPLGFDVRAPSRTGTASPMPNFQGNSPTFGPSDAQIVEAIQACLSVVDLDSVTKKQLKALAEQRLQCRLDGERKAFLDRQIDSELANM